MKRKVKYGKPERWCVCMCVCVIIRNGAPWDANGKITLFCDVSSCSLKCPPQ